MRDTSLIDTINPGCIALTAIAIHHCLSAWETGMLTDPPEFGPGGGAQHQCDTRHFNQAVNNACTDVFCHLDMDFHFSSPVVQARKIHNSLSMIR